MRLHAVLTAGFLTAALMATAVPVQAVSGGTTQVTVSTAKAQKLAKAAVLTKKDMKGYTAERATAYPTDPEDEAFYYACLGGKVPTYLARNPGFSYSKGAQTLDSSADVVKSAKVGRADFKLVAGKKVVGCMKKMFARILERDGGTVESAKVKKITVDVEGADLAIGYKYDILATIQDVTFRVVGHDLYVLVGPTEITVSPGRFDGKMPSLVKSEALAEKLVVRVRAV